MAERGTKVQRSTVPTAIEMLENAEDLQDPNAFAVQVRWVGNLYSRPVLPGLLGKVTLKHLDCEEDGAEVVHAKFVLGSDGAHSWVRRTLGIKMDGDSTGDPSSRSISVATSSLTTRIPTYRFGLGGR